MSQYQCGNMFLFVNLFFTLNSMFLLTLASTDDIDYETDYRNLQLQLEADKQTRELLIRELLLNRLLEQQQQLPVLRQPLFTYKFPPPRADETFAVPPSDPRYYHNTYEDPEKFLRHMKSDDFDNTAIRGNGDKIYKGFGDVSDNDDSSSNDDSNVYNGDEKIKSNNSNDDNEINQEQPLQPQRTVLSMSAPVPLDVQVIKTPLGDIEATHDDMIFMAIVAGCSAAAVLIVAGIGFGWYRLHKKAKAAADVEYPAYGVTGPNKEVSPTGDRKLAESAQMYHYQHQKQQIISMSSSRASNEHRGSGSEAESDEENEEGDYTVYECPGLAATGEMEVKNPLFLDDPTPAAMNQPTICPSTPDGEQKTEK